MLNFPRYGISHQLSIWFSLLDKKVTVTKLFSTEKKKQQSLLSIYFLSEQELAMKSYNEIRK